MNNQFDELAQNLARSVTRRGALKQFGVGLAGMALAALGFANQTQAGQGSPAGHKCKSSSDCAAGLVCCKVASVPNRPPPRFGVCEVVCDGP